MRLIIIKDLLRILKNSKLNECTNEMYNDVFE